MIDHHTLIVGIRDICRMADTKPLHQKPLYLEQIKDKCNAVIAERADQAPDIESGTIWDADREQAGR